MSFELSYEHALPVDGGARIFEYDFKTCQNAGIDIRFDKSRSHVNY
jgi:hypothetical protein